MLNQLECLCTLSAKDLTTEQRLKLSSTVIDAVLRGSCGNSSRKMEASGRIKSSPPNLSPGDSPPEEARRSPEGAPSPPPDPVDSVDIPAEPIPNGPDAGHAQALDLEFGSENFMKTPSRCYMNPPPPSTTPPLKGKRKTKKGFFLGSGSSKPVSCSKQLFAASCAIWSGRQRLGDSCPQVLLSEPKGSGHQT